jgi:hypothetical protein
MTEKTELIITTNNIPKSFNPINKIANGTHAILGNDWRPTANELMVLPKSLNFTIANPIPTPIITEIENPIRSLNIVMPIPMINEESTTNSTRDPATIAGDGSDTLGYMPSMNINCQIPKNPAKNNIILAVSLRFTLRSLMACCAFNFVLLSI